MEHTHEHTHTHEHEHTHTHTHDGVEHTHTHTHGHEHTHSHDEHEHDHAHCHCHDHEHDHAHEHTHSHDHDHGQTYGGDKTLAVLTYMLDHNIHHCAELKDLAAALSGEAQHQLLHAVEDFDTANAHLAKAIEELKK